MLKFGLAMVLVAGCAGLAGACGGSSEKSTFTDPGSAGSGGTATGGSSSKGGSSSAEAGADDGAAGDGSTMGGSSGSGGSSGMGGAGGSGTLPMTPDPTVRESCDDWCDAAVAAECNDSTVADCQFVCRAVANSPACNGLYAELFECSADATFACNDDGDPYPQGCELEYAAAALCVLSSPDPTVEEPCDAYCEAAEAAECMNSTPANECSYGCQLASALVPACADDWKSFVDCAEAADVSCGAQGDPTPDGCGVQYLTYVACVLEAGQ